MNSNESKPSDNVAGEGGASKEAFPDRVLFEKFANGRSEIQIEYLGQIYRLRATRNGKLILNK
ncbi:MAG: hemin uptake protein HemP [bacterium]|nr:hemin uptake protein HemP [bacterium]